MQTDSTPSDGDRNRKNELAVDRYEQCLQGREALTDR